MPAQLFVVKTAIGREEQVLDFVASNVRKAEGVYSLLFPHGMSGYILIEAENADVVKAVTQGVPYVRRGGVLRKPVRYEEIENLIEFKPELIDIHVGNIVSIIAGPFKGERAKVTRINTQKSEVILELLEAAVQIPITINLDSVKVIDKKEAEVEKKEKEEP